MDMVGYVTTAQESLRSLKTTRLGALRPVGEFIDWQRISWPGTMSEYSRRAGYNVRYFSANYAIIVAIMALWSLLTNPLLLIALGFVIGGFLAIGRFVPEPFEFNGKTITPQNCYTILLVIGLPLLWWAAPLATVFGIVGSSACVIGAHAGLLEPGVESEYEGVETV